MSNATKTTTQGALLFIHAQTALHPGSGTALGTVDLPVQRERHTGWPNIAGSALKGVLRDACRERIHQNTGQPRKVVNEEDPDVVTIFGPGKVNESSAHAGALTVSDARILAYPVRSLRGVFAWVTCRGVLERLCRDLALIGAEPPSLPPNWPGEHRALVPTNSPLLVGQSAQATIVLEEFDYKVVGPSGTVAKWLADHAVADRFAQERMKSHLVVLSDDDFTHFVRNATEIVARIALDYERKTVKEGALFYQEFLPAETLMYSVLLANSSRNQKASMDAAQVLDKVRQCLEDVRVLQIGGDETTGKGLCAVHVLQP